MSCDTDGTIVPVKKKIKKTAARKHVVCEVTPRRIPRVSWPTELVEDEGLGLGGTPHRSPRVLALPRLHLLRLVLVHLVRARNAVLSARLHKQRLTRVERSVLVCIQRTRMILFSTLMMRTPMMMLLPLTRYECLIFTAFSAFLAIVVVFVFLALPWCT